MARSGTVLDISLVSVDGLCADAPFFQEIGGNFQLLSVGLGFLPVSYRGSQLVLQLSSRSNTFSWTQHTMCLLSSHREQIWFWLGAYTLSADQCYCGGLSVFCFVLFFVFFVRGSCGHCNHWIGQLCVQSSVCRLGGSIVILNSLVVFFPGFHALRGESFQLASSQC